MIFEERERRILELLASNGSVNINELSKYFNLSRVTIRKHLDIIANEGVFKRVRGGLISTKKASLIEPYYNSKIHLNIKKKKIIGSKAASYVNDDETIIIDSGSTTLQIVSLLYHKKNIRILTDDLKIALLISSRSNLDVYLAGGKVRQYIFSTFGQNAISYINGFNADKLFLSADAVDIKRGITDSSHEESLVKREMMNSAKEIILVCDSSKFGLVKFSSVANLDEINRIITDHEISQDYIDYFKKNGIKMDIV